MECEELLACIFTDLFQVDDQIYENGYIYFSDETLTDKEVYCFGLIDVLTKYV